MKQSNTETVTITKINRKTKKSVKDLIVKEVPFTIKLNASELVTLLCSPSDLEDLAIGFLFTSGLIGDINEIKKITIDNQLWTCYVEGAQPENKDLTFRRLYTSGCGKGIIFYNTLDIMQKSKINSKLKVDIDTIPQLMNDFQKRSKIYLTTGGTHSAALADKNKILIFREDIGRHNAIDKVVGCLLSKKKMFDDKILITSGRITSEVVSKTKRCGIPIIISRSSATDQAIKLAQKLNLTIVGFARGPRMNIYSGKQRIL